MNRSLLAIAAAGFLVALVGCGTSDSPDAADQSQTELPPEPDIDQALAEEAERLASASERPLSEDGSATSEPAESSSRDGTSVGRDGAARRGEKAAAEFLEPLRQSRGGFDSDSDGASVSSIIDQDAPASVKMLKADLPPAALIRVLQTADQDLQMAMADIGGNRGDPAKEAARQIARVKLAAARRLSEHSDATDGQQTIGKRGELQGLSHLTQLGDVSSAEALEELATSYVDDPSTELQIDSRLVLLGFAIERLRAGKDGAADNMVELGESLAELADDTDMMVLVAIGQGRQWLDQLDHHDQAKRVRELILQHFADADDENVAQLAAKLAGNVEYDEIDELVSQMQAGQTVDEARWRDAVHSLLDASPDIASVRYLCGTTLQCEYSQPNLADATYKILKQRIASEESALGREARQAIELRDARRARIGNEFAVDANRLSGDIESVQQLRGQVVLMPFWSTRIAESLQLFGPLQQLAQQHDEISLLGMNLDSDRERVAEQMREAGLTMNSLQGVSDGESPVSPLAREFGMGGHPMTVILDREGVVHDIVFGWKPVESIVNQLLEQ